MWVCYKAAGPGCLVSVITTSAVGCRFLTDQKAAEKVAPSSEAGGTAQGDLGPLENPLGLDGVDRELRRLWYRKPRAGSFPVSRIAKVHPVSRSDSDPLPQVGIGPAERFATVAQTVSAGKPSLRRGRCLHRPAGWPGGGCRLYTAVHSRPQCRAGDFARRGALRRRMASGTMQASSPAEHRARPCPASQDTSAAKRQCTGCCPPPRNASPWVNAVILPRPFCVPLLL